MTSKTRTCLPLVRLLTCALVALVVAGCANTRYQAPVEDRGSSKSSSSTEAPPRVLPGAENAGKPGYYTVKPGDTLIRIGLEAGQNWRDIQKWNSLDNANVIEVGQVLRVVPPNVDAAAIAAKPIAAAKVESRPLDAKAPSAGPSATNSAESAPVVAAASTPAPASAPLPPAAPAKAPSGEDEPNWMWPSSGAVTAGFDEARNKGLSISGKAGDPVFAAGDGRVVYSGSGLRGYGNLVIIKHNDTYLTAYAHNQTLLVKEDQAVRRGQKIAEMGSSDADKVHLHFEVRRKGRPIDPAKVLPAR